MLTLAFLISLAPALVVAECKTPNFQGVCAGITDGPTSISSGISDTNIEQWVSTELVKFTSGSSTNLKGSASDDCYNQAQKLLCLFKSAPLKTREDSACSTAAAAMPSIDTCETTLTTCVDSLNKKRINVKSYCETFRCDPAVPTDCGGVNGTCAAPKDSAGVSFVGHPSTCTCNDGIIGTKCFAASQACPTASGSRFACSGHGSCDFFSGNCDCLLTFTGQDCSKVNCPVVPPATTVCAGHGVCTNAGVCQCDAGFIGADCDIEISENGLTSGEFAGAVIGGLIFGFLFCGLAAFLVIKGD
jgi:hypothetical protein